MKILWVTNVPLPEASKLMNEGALPFGGWLIHAASKLANEKSISLTIAFPKNDLMEPTLLKGEQIDYYAFPYVNERNREEINKNKSLLKIVAEVNPQLVHIFGSELPHTLAMVNACQQQDIEAVISIQGLVSFIAKHYMNGIPTNVQRQFTFRDFIKWDHLKKQQKRLYQKGQLEVEALQKVDNIIGRTTWDKACTEQINPNATYHYCNETLRAEFYHHKWELDQCERYSIFVSQGSYPIKGLHFMLEAMSLILAKFPLAKLYVGGPNITKARKFTQKLRRSSYAKYIAACIKKYRLEEKVIFTGLLDEKQMCAQYLRTNVFVCPSTIENSPNSLGEAMLLGVPSVASDVGGIADLLTHRVEGFLYQADAPYMLAHYVCELFENTERAREFSSLARLKASHLHNEEENHQRLIEIYTEIVLEKGHIYESIG